MKKRFFAILAIVILLMSVFTFALTYISARESIEKLVLERANTRLSMIVQGFSIIANDIDIYAYVNFPYENISVMKGSIPVFQYGTSRLDQNSPKVVRIGAAKGGYDFTLHIDLEGEISVYIRPFRQIMAITAILYAAIFAVSGAMFINTVVGPISSLASRVARITSHNMRERIPAPKRKDEISQLIHAFNSMLDDVEGTYSRLKTFVDDMTHDIVTPVQIMEGYRQLIELHGKDGKIVDEYLEVSKVQLFRLKAMTSSLKAAFLIEKRRHVEFADASGITARNVSYYRELYADLHFDAAIEKDVRFPVEAIDFERMENILIDNAVKYGSEGGRIEVRLTKRELEVRDFGKGMDRPESAFERGRQDCGAERRGDGAGIGLSIVKKFSEEYGFAIELDSRPGKGCSVVIRFPDREQPDSVIPRT